MPKVKIKRDDVIRPKEILEVVQRASLDYPWLACAIALSVIFGKRVTEVLSLKREQISFDDRFLTVKFRVGKKREKETPIPTLYVKRKTIAHPLVQYIVPYVKRFEQGYIFPFERKASETRCRAKLALKDGTRKEVEYRYKVEGGFISRQLALYYLQKIAPDWWWHLSRLSLATTMAEDGATEEELMNWFDWETPATAHKYVKRGTRLTEKWSERTW